MTVISQEVRDALSADHPLDAMAELVRRWKNSGVTKEQAERRLSDIRHQLVLSGECAAEDVILDVMDLVVGWSRHDRRIY